MARPVRLEVSTSVAADRLSALEQEIRRRIREFEVPALLDLLASMGHGPGDIQFRAHRASGPQPTLLHAIEFPPRSELAPAAARVIVTVNLGLLSCRSPLPSYFQRFFQNVDTYDPVTELLEVLDRSLLHTRLAWDRRERSVARWDMTRRNFLRIFGLDSPLGLDWLFRRVFPELGVEVRRTSDEYRVPYDGATLGRSKLGECTFGAIARVGVHDLEVLLVCESALYREEEPWVLEGDRRLRSVVFPLLDEVCMTLTVVFILLDRGVGVRLKGRDEAAQLGPPGHVGYDPLTRPEQPGSHRRPTKRHRAHATPPPSRIELYRGALPRHEPDSDALEQVLAEEPMTALSVDQAGTCFAADTVGQAVELAPVYHRRGELTHRYRATIHWGARAWHHDDPHGIRLACEGIPKMSPSPHDHPRLWAWLRDRARAWIADQLTREVLDAFGGERVTARLIEELIESDADQHLQALSWSSLVPMQQWEDEAWRRFSRWRAP